MTAKTLLAYVNSDENLLTKLEEALAPLQWKNLILVYDCEINSDSRAKKLLETADIVLLLISSQFLSSDYCYSQEMLNIIEMHKKGKLQVIPVILRPAYWGKTVFSMLQAVPVGGKAITLREDETLAFREVVTAVEKIATEMSKDVAREPTFLVVSHAHLDLLKQGIMLWNQWREDHSEIQPNLQEANLSGTNLKGANLRGANLSGAELNRADLNQADLRFANLSGALLRDSDLSNTNLSFADLSKADLSFAILRGTDLRGANLVFADLKGVNTKDVKLSDADLSNTHLGDANLLGADLVGANLRGANLRGANLTKANLSLTNLTETDLNEALLSITVFGSIDLRQVKGLENVVHKDPSIIDIQTLIKSEGQIPEVFLRGVGIPESFLEYVRSLSSTPIQYFTCFISYSAQDETFARRLHADLQSQGVRCWFAPQDLKVGDYFSKRIDEAIRVNDKLLLILSQHSLESNWIENEVEASLEREQSRGSQVLLPIRLDDAVMQTSRVWAATLRRTRHIGDFTRWKQNDFYQQGLERLLRDLKHT